MPADFSSLRDAASSVAAPILVGGPMIGDVDGDRIVPHSGYRRCFIMDVSIWTVATANQMINVTIWLRGRLTESALQQHLAGC